MQATPRTSLASHISRTRTPVRIFANVLPANHTLPPTSPTLYPIDVIDGICRVRPHGLCTLVEAVELVKDAIAQCRGRHIAKLLFNAKGLRGVPIPSLVDRFLMVEEWAFAASSMVTVALVVHAEYIHPEKFGIVVATDLGLTCDVCTSEEDALQWLAADRSS